MKNFKKEGQKLPLYGIGPWLVLSMAVLTTIGVVLSCLVFKGLSCTGIALWIFRVIGIVLIICGITIWYVGALKSKMDSNITDNRLKTDGIYAWVRNPMYSGLWILFSGISFMWANWCVLAAPVLCWILMTVVLKNTEEKWLKDLYGQEYIDYCKRVNRCIPWFPKK